MQKATRDYCVFPSMRVLLIGLLLVSTTAIAKGAEVPAGAADQGAATASSPQATALRPPPAWVVIEPPAQFRAFLGKNAMPEPYPQLDQPIGMGT
jgi:hypothetical protein